jgi:cyclopropane fatty-acyl-phospholipid synthase-like methyltransferase
MIVESMRRKEAEASIERARVDAERTEALKDQRRAAEVEQHVKAIVHDWPELTEEQRERLRRVVAAGAVGRMTVSWTSRDLLARQ